MCEKMPYADLQKRRDNVRRWKRANPEKVKAQKQRYRARRAQSPQPPPPPPPQGRYNLRPRKVKRPDPKIQLMNLVVVLKDYRKEGQCGRDRLLARKRNREYRERNREKIETQRKEYRQRNREKVLAQVREHYWRNRDRILAQRKDYLQKNLERIRV